MFWLLDSKSDGLLGIHCLVHRLSYTRIVGVAISVLHVSIALPVFFCIFIPLEEVNLPALWAYRQIGNRPSFRVFYQF